MYVQIKGTPPCHFPVLVAAGKYPRALPRRQTRLIIVFANSHRRLYGSMLRHNKLQDMIKLCVFVVVWLINILLTVETIRLILFSIIDRSNLPITLAVAVAVALYVLITTSAKRVNSLTDNAKEALGMDY